MSDFVHPSIAGAPEPWRPWLPGANHRPNTIIIIVIGLLAWMGWSEEQIAALLAVVYPVVLAARGGQQ